MSKVQKAPAVVQIKNFPELSPKLKKRVVVGVRPFRKGGIKLETQKFGNKSIIYNYGHGGAGVSLAPACGIQAAELAVKAQPKDKKVIILGSGIIGLMTAIECADRGLSVTVYTERIPQVNESNVLNLMTSQIAPGYWLPFNYEFSDLDIHRKRSEVSYGKFKEWSKKSKNVYEVECYQQMSDELFDKSTPSYIKQTSKPMKIKVGNKQFDVIYFRTLQIHLQNFLQDLMKQCISKGVKFQNKKVSTVKQMLELKDDVVIACLGLNSKKVFNDENIYGVKGHLVQLQNTTGFTGILGFQFQGQFAMYCFKDKVLIGLSRQRSEEVSINQETVKMLEQRAYNFYKHVGLDVKPKL